MDKFNKIIKRLMKINHKQAIIFCKIFLNQKTMNQMNKVVIMIKLINKKTILKKINKNIQKNLKK